MPLKTIMVSFYFSAKWLATVRISIQILLPTPKLYRGPAHTKQSDSEQKSFPGNLETPNYTTEGQ